MILTLAYYLFWFLLPFIIVIITIIATRKLLKPKQRKSGDLKKLYGGGWALVTGASSGIGSDYVELLASEGFNVIVTARREERLISLCEEITKKYKVETKIVLADLSESNGAMVIYDAVKDMDVSLVCNNAGAGWFGLLRDETPQHIQEIIQLNCTSMAVLTHLFINKMKERKQPSGMLITSSLGAYCVIPTAASYSSAKAMVSMFSSAVYTEEQKQDSKIQITVLEPGATATEFSAVSTSGKQTSEGRTDMVTSKFVADQALNYLLAGKQNCIPVDTDYYLSVVFSVLPRWVVASFLYQKYSSFSKKEQ